MRIRRWALPAALAVLAGVGIGPSTGAAAPPRAAADPGARLAVPHLDEPGPGVVLGAEVPTATLTARTRTDVYRARFARSVRPSGAAVRADGSSEASTLVTPPGRPGLYGLTEHAGPSCTGDGQDGNRVQVLYAVEAGRPDRYDEVLESLQSFVADVDDTFALSSRESGRRVRWVSDADCVPVIDPVTVPAGTLAGADLNPLKNALQRLGYTASDRKYLVFADAARLCGVADVYLDDTPAATNTNNGGRPMYARVDSSCWAVPRGGHSTPAHELMHMLGAVQASAPHATANNHCTDEHDAMCYADGTARALTYVCTQPNAEELFDCGRDDYFDPRPVVASHYLRTHWNTAGSSFLDRVGVAVNQVRLPPTGTITGPTRIRPGLASTLTVRADRAVRVAWTASPAVCLPATALGRQVRLQCPTNSRGPVTVTATLTDPQGRRTRVNRVVALAGSRARLGLVVTAPRTVPTGSPATVRVVARRGADPVRTALSLQQYDRSSRRWTTVATTTTDVNGVGSFTVRRTTPGLRTLRVRARVSPASGWTAVPSSPVRLTVA